MNPLAAAGFNERPKRIHGDWALLGEPFRKASRGPLGDSAMKRARSICCRICYKEAKLRLVGGRSLEIDAPKPWFDALDLLAEQKGKALILGATDTGKSTLARFLISQLCRRGLRVGLIDADIGQSFLGPPTTIGFSVFRSDPDWEAVLSRPEIFFVGSTTPEGHFSLFLMGIERMLKKALSSEADVTLIDTTGFVSGEGGRELKRRKIDLVSPQWILALQRSDELEPILKREEGGAAFRIFRLPLSNQVRARSMEERRAYRTERFEAYFSRGLIREMNLDDLQIEGEVLDPEGQPLPFSWALKINGLLIGLKDSRDETLALGLIKGVSQDEKRLRVLTPLEDLQAVRSLQLSSLKVILSS